MIFGFPWRLVGIGAGLILILIVGAVFVGAVKENGRLKAQLDAAIDVANANAQAAADQRAEFDRIQAESLKAAQQKARIRAVADKQRKEIIDAPASDDGPIAPVLRRALDGVRVDQDPAPSGAAAGARGRPGAADGHAAAGVARR